MNNNKVFLFFIVSSFISSSLFINSSYVWTVTGGANSMTGENYCDYAGYSIAMTPDGNIVAVGEMNWDDYSCVPFRSGHGRVRVYSLTNGSWTELGTADAMAGQYTGGSAGYSVAINSDGTIVAVGEPGSENTGFENGYGRVYVYSFSGGDWTELGDSYPMRGEMLGDQAGFAVAMNSSGNMVAVAEPGFDSNNGRVRVFNLTGDVWAQTGGTLTGENSGGTEVLYSVAMSSDGNTVVVGEPNWNNNGRVRVYNLTGGSWVQTGNDIGWGGGTQVGESVAISSDGTRVAVADNNTQVRVYHLSNNTWFRIGNIIYLSGNIAPLVGLKVAMSSDGQTVVIGQPGFYNDISAAASPNGRTQVYQLSSNSWNQVANDIFGEQAITDILGRSVAISADGTRIAVGDNYIGNSGRVRVYVLSADFNPNTLLAKTLYLNVASPTTPGARSNFSPGQGTPFGHSLTSYIIAKGQ